MPRTVFRTPILTPLLRGLFRLGLRLSGWRVTGVPPTDGSYVLIGAPHTSNWDFVLMLAAVLDRRLDVHWMGKDALFPFPLGGFMRWLGGIPVDRSRANNLVDAMVETYRRSDNLVVVIPPEGTRRKVEHWKTGFYWIARNADVPIVLGYLDYARKEAGFGPVFTPTSDLERDLADIRAFYADKRAKYPARF